MQKGPPLRKAQKHWRGLETAQRAGHHTGETPARHRPPQALPGTIPEFCQLWSESSKFMKNSSQSNVFLHQQEELGRVFVWEPPVYTHTCMHMCPELLGHLPLYHMR